MTAMIAMNLDYLLSESCERGFLAVRMAGTPEFGPLATRTCGDWVTRTTTIQRTRVSGSQQRAFPRASFPKTGEWPERASRTCGGVGQGSPEMMQPCTLSVRLTRPECHGPKTQIITL